MRTEKGADDMKETAEKIARMYLLGLKPERRKREAFTAGLPGTGESRILTKKMDAKKNSPSKI